jgi:hypothetical protein
MKSCKLRYFNLFEFFDYTGFEMNSSGRACNIVTGVKLNTTRVLARHNSTSELAPRKNQATSTPDRKWKDCSTNCPEICQD